MFASWKAYAAAANEAIGSQKAFSDRMTKAGFTKRKGTKGARIFDGISLKRAEVTGDT